MNTTVSTPTRNVRIHFRYRHKVFEESLRGRIREACTDIGIEIVDTPAKADIVVSDSMEALTGIPHVNGQLFAVPLEDSENLPSHYRALNPNNQLRSLVEAVREKHNLQ